MRVPCSLAAFRTDRRGVSLIEFAFGAPFMILLMLLGVDVTRYVRATKQVEAVAATIGQMISVNASGNVNTTDLQFYHDSAMVIFPQVLQDSFQKHIAWGSDIGITMSSLTFLQVGPIYLPKMLWTGGTTPRSCLIPMLPAPDSAAPSSSTLPQDVFGPGSLIVVDVTFSFRPLIATAFLKTLAISRSYYVAPRYVPTVNFTSTSPATDFAKAC